MESHGGTTFCGVAALHLSGQLGALPEQTIEGMKRWLLFRQVMLNCYENAIFVILIRFFCSVHQTGGWFQWQAQQTSGLLLFLLDRISFKNSERFSIYQFRKESRVSMALLDLRMYLQVRCIPSSIPEPIETNMKAFFKRNLRSGKPHFF